MGKDTSNDENVAGYFESIRVRLDTIILLLLASKFPSKDGGVKIGEATPFLHAAGFTPTEIAAMFGKKKATEVAPHLYSRKKTKTHDK